MRGGMIVVGNPNEVPEVQIWRNSVFEFEMLYRSTNADTTRPACRNNFSARRSQIVTWSMRLELSGSTSTGWAAVVEAELNDAADLIARLMPQHRRQLDPVRRFNRRHQLRRPVGELVRAVLTIGVDQIVGRERQGVLAQRCCPRRSLAWSQFHVCVNDPRSDQRPAMRRFALTSHV